MDLQSGHSIYERQHNVAVLFESKASSNRWVTIKILKLYSNKLVLKVQEVDNYNFNYTGEIDHAVFNQMKHDQSLEINFDEIHSQIVDMLKDTLEQNMCLRLEANCNTCKLVFYEKSRLKSLILLTIDLQVTNQGEIIDEMAKSLQKVRETNKHLEYQLDSVKINLAETKLSLHSSQVQGTRLESHFREQVAKVGETFTATFACVEAKITEKLSRLARRHVKLQNDLETLKNENRLKCESNVRLVGSLHALRIENERNMKLIDNFKLEVNHLRLLKGNGDDEMDTLRRKLQHRQRDCDEHIKQIDELKRDLQEATLIIAQKTKMHDEIGKDLVQANSMLVNFNNQYDNLAKEYDAVKLTLDHRERKLADLEVKSKEQREDFEAYKAEYGPEKLQLLQNELFLANKTQQELDKQCKEAVKLNALLTRKLSSDVPASVRNQSQTQTYINNLPPPSQRSNY